MRSIQHSRGQQFHSFTSALVPLILGGMLLARPTVGHSAQPYWDPSPGTANDVPLFGSALEYPIVARDGALYAWTRSLTYPFSWVALNRWTKCGGWENLGGPIMNNGTVSISAMFIRGKYIYLGGSFQIEDPPATNIIKFDTEAGVWLTVDNGSLTKPVKALVVDNQDRVYAGLAYMEHELYPPGTLNPELLKVWNSNSWQTVGSGLIVSSDGWAVYDGGGVQALATDGTNVYVGGGIDGGCVNGNCVISYALVKWTGTTWVPFATPWNPVIDFPHIRSIGVSGQDVIATGEINAADLEHRRPAGMAHFTAAGAYVSDVDLICYDYCSIQGWNCPGVGFSIARQGSSLYLGGGFDHYGNIASTPPGGPAGHDALSWNSGTWSPLADTLGEGLNYYAWAVAADSNSVYFVGGFTTVGGQDCGGGAARWVTGSNPDPPVVIPTLIPSYVGDQFYLTINGAVASRWIVYYSDDLLTWQEWQMATLWNGSAVLTDAIIYPQRFYTVGNFCVGSEAARPAGCSRIAGDAVAWWKFQGNGLDSIGANHGTLSGNYSFVTGEVAQALYLRTKPAGSTVPSSASLNFGAGQNFAIEAWVRPTNAITTYGVMDIVDKRIVQNTHWAKGYTVCLSNGRLAFQMSDNLTALPPSWSAGPDLRDNQWHHVAVSVDRGSTTGGKMYVDGSVVYTFDPTIRPGDLGTTASLLIGLHPLATWDANYRGMLDEITIYPRTLSQTEVQGIYYAGPAGKSQ